MKLSEAQVGLLDKGFRGPRPHSNAFPLLALRAQGVPEIPGEVIDAMLRAGHLSVREVKGRIEVMKGGAAGPYGEIPDVEYTHTYELTPAGRRALEGGRDSNG